MMALECCICGRADVPLYRVNAFGVPGVWACEADYAKTDAKPIDPAVKALVGAIAGET